MAVDMIIGDKEINVRAIACRPHCITWAALALVLMLLPQTSGYSRNLQQNLALSPALGEAASVRKTGCGQAC